MRKYPSEKRVYPYLASMSKTEFETLTDIFHQFGVKGLLCTVHELADFNLHRKNITLQEKARAERVAREIAALIERMDGFEELEAPLHA
jgi:hypothetical protein